MIAIALVVGLLQGRINAAQEIDRLEKKTGLANNSAEKIKKLQGQSNYETSIPEAVRQKNTETVSARLLRRKSTRWMADIRCACSCGSWRRRLRR